MKHNDEQLGKPGKLFTVDTADIESYPGEEGQTVYNFDDGLSYLYRGGIPSPLGWTPFAFIGQPYSHGDLLDLSEDDHSQYHTDARGDARYAPIGFVGCQAYNNSNIAIGNASFTLVTLNSESYDSSSMHSTSSNTGRVVAPSAGYYLASAKVKFAYHATGLRAIVVNVNSGGAIGGGTIIAYHAQMAISSGSFDTPFMIATPVYLNANDYVEMFVYQNSGGNLNLLYSAEHSPYLSMIKFK